MDTVAVSGAELALIAGGTHGFLEATIINFQIRYYGPTPRFGGCHTQSPPPVLQMDMAYTKYRLAARKLSQITGHTAIQAACQGLLLPASTGDAECSAMGNWCRLAFLPKALSRLAHVVQPAGLVQRPTDFYFHCPRTAQANTNGHVHVSKVSNRGRWSRCTHTTSHTTAHTLSLPIYTKHTIPAPLFAGSGWWVHYVRPRRHDRAMRTGPGLDLA
ncbi:hypothetical protein F4802DRAFT_267804 [Xylaria palmicola]|nr:hypothetical protein F4802DRAFT_267804 [Xylaria palmicola]